ncbi:MAG TPA: type II secretion system F family protein [Myxococcales bacterium]
MAGALVSLLAGGSAFFLSLLALDAVRRAFERYKRQYLARSVNDLSGMFLFLDPQQILRLNLCALLLLAAAGYWAGGVLFAALAAVAGFFSPSLLVRFYRRRRLLRFNAQLADGLQQMANALRAGFTLQQAIDHVGRESNAPLRQELGLLIKEVKLGLPLDDAIAAMAKRVGSEELDLMATSTAIARQLGGNLAELFESIAATIRERFRLEGRIAALTSQGKLQGLIVAALPLCVGLFLDAYRPDLIAPMFETAYGYVLVGAVVLLQGTGFVLIRRIVAIDV